MKRLPGLVAFSLCAMAVGRCTALAATCSPTLFIQAAEYPTGGTGADVAVADFDGDGFPDVVVAHGNDATISVLLNAGDGTLGPPIVTSVGQTAQAIAAADLRGNGTMDAIVATYSEIFVLLGHGDGTFDAPVSYPTGVGNIRALLVDKFDANGTWDVVVASQYDDHLSFLPGNGNGTFGAPIETGFVTAINGLAAGDFDQDGHPDLIGSVRDSGFVVYLRGVGDGSFEEPTSFVAGTGLAGLTASDVDGDGMLDIAVVSDTAVSILLGNGDGGFQAALQYSSGIRGGEILAEDLDHDGVLDLVVGGQADFYGSGNQVSVLRGAGDGTFGTGEAYFVGRSGPIASGDLNGDSYADLVTCGVSDPSIYVLLDTPAGTLLAIPDSPLPSSPGNADFAAGDWNGDGRLDFAWATFSGITVVQADAAARYSQTAAIAIGGFNPQVYGVAAAHVDADASLDLVASTYSDVLIATGDGDGTFQAPVGVFNSFQLGAVAAADFNGDGHDDIAVTQGCCGSGFIDVLLGNGDGTFQQPVQTALGSDATLLLPANFDGDANRDLAVVTNGSVWIFLSNGDGTFSTADGIATSGTAQIALGEFDGSAADLLVSDGAAHAALYPGNGDGTFGAPVLVALPSPGGSLTAGDYDGEGHGDFAVTVNGTVLVFLGLGGDRFQAPLAVATSSTSGFLVTGSITGSGLDDIAILDQGNIGALVNSRLAATARGGGALTIGSPAVFTADGSGYGPVTYQWLKDSVPLADGSQISGATTDTLTIDPISFADAGSYRVVVTDSCGSVASNLLSLSVEFADVPLDSPFHGDIITVATNGIAAGCGGGNYCPTSPVRRDQMAVFLLKSEHGSGYTPPACSGVFADVPCPSAFADWVEQLAAEGVTGGCGGGNYCPDQSVTRAQMAVFLLKTSQGSSYTPPPATGIFGDVPPGAFAADFIEDLFNRGITGGCQASPLLYCPGSSVLRQQMATFLVRTFLTP